jgi:hypothetical protein
MRPILYRSVPNTILWVRFLTDEALKPAQEAVSREGPWGARVAPKQPEPIMELPISNTNLFTINNT